MLAFLPPLLRALVACVLLGINTLFWCVLLFFFALVRLVLPFRAVRRVLDPVLNGIANGWVTCNSWWMNLTQKTEWDVDGLGQFSYRGWYLVNCNHQSWVDIFVLQRVFNGRIPLLKFFLKQQLIYVPVMGLAWWALDFPFMRRHSDQVLRKHPEKRLEDLEATKRACEKFALVPTSVMNFVEGTRFTPAKRVAQASPYQHLLKPKAGGLALALQALGNRFDSLLDVTIVYPGGAPSFWQFLRGDLRKVIVRVDRLPVPAVFSSSDYVGDPKVRKEIQRWLHEIWLRKDALIGRLLRESASG